MSFPHLPLTAAHALRQRRLQQQQDRIEEEEMTNYTSDELDKNWEFKIVRSERGAFRRPEIFQQLIQEEALAGWEMVEKLDDRRVRFKRRKDARGQDFRLPPGFDPYRTQFDRGASRTLVLVIAGLATVLALGGGAAFFGLSKNTAENSDAAPWILIGNSALIGVIFVIMLVAIILRRR